MFTLSPISSPPRYPSKNLLRVSALLMAAQETAAGAGKRLLPRSLKKIPVWRPDGLVERERAAGLAAQVRTAGTHAGHPITA